MPSSSLGQEFRRGVGETARYALSHHTSENHHRCYEFGGDREIRFCARCTGIYLALLPGITTAWYGFYGQYHLLVVATFPLFALVDWAYTTFTPNEGLNLVRTTSGAMLGFAYGIGLVSVVRSFPDPSIILIGGGYAIVAGLLLVVAHYTTADPV